MAHTGPRRQDPVVGPLALPAALEPLAAKDAVSAGALERFAGCPVSWLVDDVLEPEKLEPDPEAMVRGSYAHKVLEVTYQRAARADGRAPRDAPPTWPPAERILLEALEAERGEFRLSPNQTRVRAAVRRLEFDLLRYLRHEAGRDGSFEPEYLELRFGFEDSDHPAVELADGTRVRGLIDRVDTWDGWALVRDYKSGKTDKYKVADWEKENRFQAALYMLVAERALGLKPAGGVYVPLGGTDRRPRGMVAAELAEQLGSDFVDNDVVPEAEFAERTEWAEGSIADGGHADARRRSGVVPRQLRLARRLLAPLDLPGGDVSADADAFTDEQARAIDRRDGSVLVSAGAGSGKTSVLVERFVQAVLAGRLRGRLDPGHHLHREGRGAAHRPRAAAAPGAGRAGARARGRGGLDLDHPRLLRAGAAHPRAGRRAGPRVPGAGRRWRPSGWPSTRSTTRCATSSARGQDPGRLALLAAYTPDKLADMVRTAYAHLRSQGQRRPRLPEMTPPRAGGPARGAGARRRAAALAELGAHDTVTAVRTRAKLERCAAVLEALAAGDVAEPAEIKKLGFKATAKVLQGPACAGLHRGARRPTWPTARTTASTTTTCWCAS